MKSYQIVTFHIALIIFCAPVCEAASNIIYKCLNSDGHVEFKDQPCPKESSSSSLGINFTESTQQNSNNYESQTSANGIKELCIKEMQNISGLCDQTQYIKQCALSQLSPECAKLYGTPAMRVNKSCGNESMIAAEACAPSMVARQRECIKKNITPTCWKLIESMNPNMR